MSIPITSKMSDLKIDINDLFSSGDIHLSELPPLSLYVHFPWCINKCPYCDFNSHIYEKKSSEKKYVDSLILDLEKSLPLIWGRKIYTIYIGGGTPSLLSKKELDRFFSSLRSLLLLDSNSEITIEANPSDVDEEKLKFYSEIGINRISLGIQSFNDSHLKSLGRIHDGDQSRKSIEISKLWLKNVNIDLMYGLPDQTLIESINDLKIAIKYDINHISLYNLTIEPNTFFSKYPPKLPSHNLNADMDEILNKILLENSFEKYEVSAFSKKKYESKHNYNYWEFGDYLGIGAGAHSKLSFSNKVLRQAKFKNPESYIKNSFMGNALVEQLKLDKKSISFEFMLNALRLTKGFNINLFTRRTGLSIKYIEENLNKAEKQKLIYRDYKKIIPTELGKKFLNDLQQIFLID